MGQEVMLSLGQFAVWCCWGTSALKNLDSMMLTIDYLKIMICH